jgi:PRTRC genetic system protein E
MKLIQNFESLIQGGVALTFKVAAAGDRIRLDIIATGKDTKTGVALPSKAILGTATEIDNALDEFLPKYAGSVGRISDVLANADAELAAAEKSSSEAARRAVDEKAKGKTAGKPNVKSNAGAKRDLKAGILGGEEGGGEEGGDEEGGDDDGDGEGSAASTTLNTATPAAAPAAAAPRAAANALDASLF